MGNKLLYKWDTAGQERFRTITRSYYRGAQGIVLVYDITDEISFSNIRMWMNTIESNTLDAGAGLMKVLVGNKCDLQKNRMISKERGQQLADEFEVDFFETSAKSGIGVNLVFECIARKVKAHREEHQLLQQRQQELEAQQQQQLLLQQQLQEQQNLLEEQNKNHPIPMSSSFFHDNHAGTQTKSDTKTKQQTNRLPISPSVLLTKENVVRNSKSSNCCSGKTVEPINLVSGQSENENGNGNETKEVTGNGKNNRKISRPLSVPNSPLATKPRSRRASMVEILDEINRAGGNQLYRQISKSQTDLNETNESSLSSSNTRKKSKRYRHSHLDPHTSNLPFDESEIIVGGHTRNEQSQNNNS